MKVLPEMAVISLDVDKRYKLGPLALILAVFIASVVVTNIIGVKIMALLGFSFTAGVITYAGSFLCTDIVSEIWGRRTANRFVILGFIGNIVMLLFVQISIISPPAPFWQEKQAAFETTLGGVWRIVVASMCAYLVSQFHDVWAFHLWRRVTKGRHLWLRNNLSTFTSQIIDTVLFILIAFLGVMPAAALISMMFAQFLVKWGLAMFDTFLIYPLIWLLGPSLEGAHPTYRESASN